MSAHPSWTGPRAVGKLAIVGHVPGAQIVNTQHFILDAGVDPTTATTALLALMTDWDTNVRASYLGALPNDYRMDTIRGTVEAVPGLAHPLLASHDLTPTTLPGTGSAASGSLSDCVVIAFKTALGGKHHRGRNYYGPFQTGTTANVGFITGSGVPALINTYMTALRRYILAGAAAADYRLCVFHRPYHAGERQWTVRVAGVLTVKANPTAEAGEATPVISISTDFVVRQQRNRESGVGA